MPTITKAGRYELREELGRGAMGVVYRAHDPVIGREVAVKTMHLSETGTGMSREELVGRFQTEARAAGLLTHPNIVVIHDAGEEEGLFYITMELVEGRSLQTMLDKRQLFPLPRVMKMMEQVCSALDFAHQHRVVHRDIKPANLMLTEDDTVKITDFGTAKILQFGTAQTAHVMGTPSYMSPEQVKGKPVDGRSDIFSLGVILYELLTGEKPFPGQNITTVIYKIINEEPISPQSLDSSIHSGLSAVISRALAKDPSARYQNCHELLDALKTYHENSGSDQAARNFAAVRRSNSVGAAHANVPLARQTSVSSIAPTIERSKDTEQSTSSLSAIGWQKKQTSNNRGALLLSLILLPIIGYAGYRIYPPMVDLWQLAHQPGETSVVAPKTIPQNVTPSFNASAMPDGTLDAKPEVKTAGENSAVMTPSQPPSQQTPSQPFAAPASSNSAAKKIDPSGFPSASIFQKAVAAQKSGVSGTTLTLIPFESKIRSELQDLSLTDKVRIQSTANTLILSGHLTLMEHRELLNLLHSVPPGVRITDDIEYVDESK